MERELGHNSEEAMSRPPEKAVSHSKEKKLSLALAIALTISACAEKAKTWSGEHLQKFKERPNAEFLEKGEVDTIVKGFDDFNRYMDGGRSPGSPTISLTPMEKLNSENVNTYEATWIDGNTVLVEQHKLAVGKDVRDSIIMTDTIYQLAQDKNSGRYMVIIKQGDSLESQSEGRVLRETAIDRETGVVTYVTNDGVTGGDTGFELKRVDHLGTLEAVPGKSYVPNLGKSIGQEAVRDMNNLSMKIP